MHQTPTTTEDASGLRIAIAASSYHSEVVDSMCDAARRTFLDAGGDEHDLLIARTAGSFELTAIIRGLIMAEAGDLDEPAFDAAVAIGCIITGETPHDQHIAQSVTQGLTSIMVETGVPIAFGVLTCRTLEQARARSIDAAPLDNKGAEAMRAAIQSARTLRALRSAMERR